MAWRFLNSPPSAAEAGRALRFPRAVRHRPCPAARTRTAHREPTALHWHGVRVPNAMDGGVPLTAPPVAPGASFDYRFRVPDAGTFWYRAAPRAQQENGLYGALIVAEPTSPPVDQDHLLIFGVRRSSRDGTRQFTLNGAAALDISVRSNERLRLRFVNASVTQVMK